MLLAYLFLPFFADRSLQLPADHDHDVMQRAALNKRQSCGTYTCEETRLVQELTGFAYYDERSSAEYFGVTWVRTPQNTIAISVLNTFRDTTFNLRIAHPLTGYEVTFSLPSNDGESFEFDGQAWDTWNGINALITLNYLLDHEIHNPRDEGNNGALETRQDGLGPKEDVSHFFAPGTDAGDGGAGSQLLTGTPASACKCGTWRGYKCPTPTPC